MAESAQGTPTKDATVIPNGYEQITSLSAAAGLTVPELSQWAFIQAESQDLRWRDDGTNPTASTGMLIKSGEGMWYNGRLSAFKMIEVVASGKANVSYYK